MYFSACLTLECTKELGKYSQQYLKKTKDMTMKHSFSHVPKTTQHAWLYYILHLKTRIPVKKDKK